MQLVIVHYHLNRGGVTQVILNHLRALAKVHAGPGRLRVLVLYGGRREAWRDESVAGLDGLSVTLEAISGLDYDASGTAYPDRLAGRITATLAQQGVRAEDTVVHIHNHALGKNASLPGAVTRLSQAGFALLLQIHDFAEDFRPGNYCNLVRLLTPEAPDRLADYLYPQGSAIHYAVLNGRDRQILAAAGVAPLRLHLLPNPVSECGELPERTAARARLTSLFRVPGDHPYVLYPVRGIRRKNLGELLLWAAVSGRASHFALTLPPLNPAEQPRYAFWKQLAGELALPLLFEVGADGGLEFGENLAAADAVLTTSVAEGFGMVFLETWLANVPLVGRDLPEITADFLRSGLTFPQLSTSVHIPLDWISVDTFVQELWESYAAVLHDYGRPQPCREAFREEVSEFFADGLLDFARCSAKLQAFIVSQVAREPRRRDELRRWNPGFVAAAGGPAATAGSHIAANGRAVRQNYSLESSGMQLRALYQTVLDSPRGAPSDLPNGSAVLEAFFSLQRFTPIRID